MICSDITIILKTKVWAERPEATGQQVEDSSGQRHGGLDVVLHVAHLQTLEGEDGDQAADTAQDDPHHHQRPHRLQQGWGQRSTHI